MEIEDENVLRHIFPGVVEALNLLQWDLEHCPRHESMIPVNLASERSLSWSPGPRRRDEDRTSFFVNAVDIERVLLVKIREVFFHACIDVHVLSPFERCKQCLFGGSNVQMVLAKPENEIFVRLHEVALQVLGHGRSQLETETSTSSTVIQQVL